MFKLEAWKKNGLQKGTFLHTPAVLRGDRQEVHKVKSDENNTVIIKWVTRLYVCGCKKSLYVFYVKDRMLLFSNL